MSRIRWPRYTLKAALAVLLALATAVTAFPGQAEAANFGGLTDNGTAAYMGIGANPHPIRPLYVFGNVPLFERAQDSAGFIIQRSNNNRWVLGVNDGAALGNGFVLSTYPVGETSSTPRLLVTPQGRVGIGTVSPDSLSLLHVCKTDNISTTRAIYGETLGGDTCGVYGKNSGSGSWGTLGGSNEGVWGGHGSSGSYGKLGSTYYGAYGFSDNISGVLGQSNTKYGVMGSSPSGTGVYGDSTSYLGVHGVNVSTGNYGFLGDNNTGAYGKHNSGYQGWLGNSAAGAEGQDPGLNQIGRLGTVNEGVYGQAPGVGSSPMNPPWAGNFNGNVFIAGGLNVMAPPVLPAPGGMVSFFLPGSGPAAAPGSFIVFPPNPVWTLDPIVLNDNTTVYGTFTVFGPKLFSMPDPADPSRTINYACIEGPEAGNYIRGSAEIINGEAVINLPSHFAKVTADGGLTVQLTPAGKWLQLYVAEEGTSRIVVREAAGLSGRFHYLVQGVRKGYEDFQVMRDRAPAK